MILVAGASPPRQRHAAGYSAVIIASDELGATGRPRSRSAAPGAGINHYKFGVER
jgi:hypothetical protein